MTQSDQLRWQANSHKNDLHLSNGLILFTDILATILLEVPGGQLSSY